METMFSLFRCDDFKGDRGDDDFILKGEWFVFDIEGGLRMTLELELLNGRRAVFVVFGIVT